MLYTIQKLIDNALEEDIGSGDITSRIFIPQDKKIKAVLLLEEKGVVAGINIAEKVFKTVDKDISFKPLCRDGALKSAGSSLALIEGNARSILSAERTVVNFFSHLSGIATLTQEFVDKIKPFKAKITDTRKTIPGLRFLEKYAVSVGAVSFHKIGLWDGVLIKDNHLAIRPLRESWDFIKTIKSRVEREIKVEVEVKNLEEFKLALNSGVDIIMLDNMNLAQIKKAVKINHQASKSSGRQVLLEVSGGVNLKTVRAIAATGVDIISLGCLTHSAKAVDISLEVENKSYHAPA